MRPTVVGLNPDARPCPGAKLVEREVVRDGRATWVEEWRITVSTVADLLEIQRGAGRPHHHRREPNHRHGEGGLGPTSPRRSALPP